MNTQTAINAPPVTYEIDGEQYIAILVGYGSSSTLWATNVLNPDGTRQNISRILAFKLGATGTLPDKPVLAISAVARSVPLQVFLVYREFKECISCHRVYWEGSHLKRLDKVIERARNALHRNRP